MASDWIERLDEEVDRVRQTRDELRVQMHLAAAEAKDSWAGLEERWQRLEQRLERIGRATHEASDDVHDATRSLLQELKHGYEKIRDVL